MLQPITRSSRHLPAMAAALGAVAIIVGCGDGDDEAPSKGEAALPAAAVPIDDRAAAFEQAARSLECGDALEILHPLALPDREAGESKANCEAATSLLRDLRDFEVTASQELGTAAVVDGAAGDEELGLIWALDDEGTFSWVASSTPTQQAGTEPAAGAEPAPPVDAFLEALREGRCEPAYAAVAPASRLSYGSKKRFCAKFDDTYLASPEGFGSRLREDPDARAVELGATRNLAFYGVATEPAGYRTLAVGIPEEGGEPLVFDVIPGPE